MPTAEYLDARPGPTFVFPRDVVDALTQRELSEVGTAVFAAYDAKLLELGYPQFTSTRGRAVKEG